MKIKTKSCLEMKNNNTISNTMDTFLFLMTIMIFFFSCNSLSLRSISKTGDSLSIHETKKISNEEPSLISTNTISIDEHNLGKNFLPNKPENSKSLLEINQIYNSEEISPIKVFLNTIASTSEKAFCIKRLIGRPVSYKSYKCPLKMKIYPDVPDVCIKDCPAGLVREKENCEAICDHGYVREYDLCVDKINSKHYKPEFVPLTKADPICINGFFSNGFCYTCIGNSEHSNGLCVSPCLSGSPSDNFCSFTDDANKNLSLVNDFWARFFRSLFDELVRIIKSEKISKETFKDFTSLKEISKYILDNKNNHEVQIISGKIMIFLRDRFKINLDENWQSYMRSIFMKMLMRFEKNDSQIKNKVLAVVDDLIYFNGDHTDAYLENKNYGLESLPQTIAQFLDLMC